MNRQGNRTLWIILGGVGCIALLCLCVVAVGAFVFLSNVRMNTPIATAPIAVQVQTPTESPLPTELPIAPIEPTVAFTQPASPTQAPTQPPPTAESTPAESASGLTGSQHIDEYSLTDDFSSEALSWPIYDDGDTILKYEDGAYSFHIAASDYYDWAYFPVNFIPYEINFDVYTQLGAQDGTFGVFCQLQDAANYYYVEFDAASGDYLIGQVMNDEDIPLTEENAQGQYWQEADPFNIQPGATNRIGVGCYRDVITLFVNGQFVDDVSVNQPFADPGEAAFFVYTFDFAGPEGYKVWFDNVETYEPRQ